MYNTNLYVFFFVLCTLINIFGTLHFRTKTAIIIGLLWQCLLIITLTQYFIKKNQHKKNM